MSKLDDTPPSLEQRLARLEDRLGVAPSAPVIDLPYPNMWITILGGAALVCGYLGLGLPQHYYQPLFAALFLMLAYHRQVWRLYPAPWRWPLVLMNFLLLCLLLKLLIGGGLQYPFEWLKAPAFTAVPVPDGSAWYQRVIPDYTLTWHSVPGVSDWYINVTRLQTLMLIATLAGALFRFQPFASLTALALLVLSLPSYFSFVWDWVILFLILGGSAMYLQSGTER